MLTSKKGIVGVVKDAKEDFEKKKKLQAKKKDLEAIHKWADFENATYKKSTPENFKGQF